MTRWRVFAATLLFAAAAHEGRAQNVEHPHGPGVGACATCHTADAWKPAAVVGTFRHAPKTFPLDGAHARTACATCHRSLEFGKAKATCGSCHADVHKGEVGTECSRCHTTRSFVDLERMRRVHEMTRFPLRGAHAAAACASCHASSRPGQPQFTGRSTTCSGCHLEQYRGTKAPDHQAARFPTDCAACHGPVTWAGGKFDHALTKFPLENAHRTVACSGCHADKVYVGKPTACATCHMPDYTRSAKPPHALSGFPTGCATCHSTKTWTGAPFRHDLTNFPLTGAHLAAICTDCHADQVYHGKPSTCVSCHQTNYTRTVNPPHQQAGFSMECATCHNTARWLGAVFNHATTRFPLIGAHAVAPCAGCHADGVYRGKPTACASCHQGDAAKVVAPSHAGFPSACESCHSTVGWKGAAFDHNATQFPLSGAHRAVVCNACHGDGVYKGKPTTCISCHQARYAGAALPPHSALGFSTACLTCHTTAAWQPASFDHATTRFPLTGAHRAATCANCHGDGVYRGKPTACASCHQAAYTATKSPAHAASGFPTTCELCHTTTAWTPASFNHATTRFPLTGAHATTACAGCHGDGVYRGKTMTCSGCHLGRYQATTNPAHAAAGFPQTCETCHNTTTWLGATFNHDPFFPIYSGAHKGRWTTCATCHPSPTAYAVFTCTSCHTKSQTDPKHKSVSGYAFDSNRCYACHPRGKAG